MRHVTCLCHIPTTVNNIATERIISEVRQQEMEITLELETEMTMRRNYQDTERG